MAARKAVPAVTPLADGPDPVEPAEHGEGSDGVHVGKEHPVKVDDYPERPYKDAITAEHRAELEEAGLL